jgi:adenylate cyclase
MVRRRQRVRVSTGRFALRGISRAQDLHTLDPDLVTDQAAAGSYQRCLET